MQHAYSMHLCKTVHQLRAHMPYQTHRHWGRIGVDITTQIMFHVRKDQVDTGRSIGYDLSITVVGLLSSPPTPAPTR